MSRSSTGPAGSDDPGQGVGRHAAEELQLVPTGEFSDLAGVVPDDIDGANPEIGVDHVIDVSKAFVKSSPVVHDLEVKSSTQHPLFIP